MRVAHCLLGYFPQIGGAENQARLLVSELAKKNTQITVLTRRYGEPGYSDENPEIVRFWKAWGRGSKEIASICIGFYLLLHRKRFDIFHVHQLNILAFVVTVVGSILGKPVIIKVANSGLKFDLDTLRERRLGRYMAGYILRSRARFVALSSPIRDLLLESGVEKSRIQTIPNGVVCGPVYSNKGKITSVAFIGRLESVKRPGIVLELAERFPELNYHICGDGSLRASLEVELERRKLTNLTLHGNVQEIQTIYRDIDMIIHPSEAEGMSNTLLEASTRNIVCLVSDIPENRALFDGCEDIVYYVQGSDLQLWISEFESCVEIGAPNNTDDCIYMSSKYSIERIAQLYLNFYKSILQ